MASKKRKWLGALLSGIILFGVIAITLPFWFPYALRPVASHFGVQYGEFLRVGKDKFALTKLYGKKGPITFSASRVEGFLPWKWKAQMERNVTNNAPPVFLLLNGWSVQMSSSNAPASTNSPYETLQLFERQAARLNHWIPNALFLNGVFRWKNEEVGLATIALHRGELTGDITLSQATTTLDFKADLSNEVTNIISLRIDSWDVRARLRIVNQPSSAAITLTGNWKTNHLSGAAVFKPMERLPSEAHLVSDGVTVPAQVLKAEGFDSFVVSFTNDWKTNGFTIETSVHAQPVEGRDKKRPEFDLSLAARGNLSQATLVNARISAPWLDAHLDKPVTFDYKGNLETFDVPFQLAANMNRQSWLPVTGFLEGEVLLNPGSIREPNLRFTLKGQQISGYGLEAAGVQMKARLEWPLLDFSEGTFSQTNGATGTFTAKLNLETREVSPSRFAFNGKIGDSLLPKGLNYQSANVAAEVSGFWPKLHHSGSVTVTNLSYAALSNATVSAAWSGTYRDLDSIKATLQAGTNHFDFVGAVHFLQSETNLAVRTLNWLGGERLMFGASSPFELGLRAVTNSPQEKIGFPEIVVKGLKLSGQGTTFALDAAVAWPNRGQLQISATNLNSLLFAPLVAIKVPEIILPRLILAAAWDQGPLQIDLNLLYNAIVQDLGLVTSSIDFQSDEKGLFVNALNVSAPSGAIIRAEGTLPIRIFPGDVAGKRLRISGTREVNFHASSAPNAKFWDSVGKWTGFYIQDPVLKLDVTGKTKEPVGTLTLTASELHTTRIKRPIPHVENVHIRAKLDASALNLEALDFSVEQQFVHTSANVPVSENLWRKSHGQILDYLATNATVAIRGANLQIGPFSRYLPAMLAPQGTASIDLSVLPPLKLKGQINVKDVSTRPIESLGPVQSITALIRLDDRAVRIDNFSGELAGESLAVNGTVDWSEPLLATGFPGLNLHISGKNIPLARRPDLILRSDVDLAVTHSLKAAPAITGAVNLRNSFFLSDLKFLVPGRLAKPRNRPPYFSIEQEPFANWMLDLRVRGDRFMKVRSPFFSGEVSSDFKIGGTLREPLALGDATINSGFVQFPFANLEVKQGLVTLALDDPYLPKLFVTAGARAFGYELKMQVSGPADVPVIEFSSTPSLTSEEIVLMLTAGQLPQHELTFSNQQKAGTLALFLGKSLWAKFGADEPGAERLTIRSGEDISDQGRQTYSVEYRLSKNWSLVGEYDRFSAVNAGLKWRLYSR